MSTQQQDRLRNTGSTEIQPLNPGGVLVLNDRSSGQKFDSSKNHYFEKRYGHAFWGLERCTQDKMTESKHAYFGSGFQTRTNERNINYIFLGLVFNLVFSHLPMESDDPLK